MLLQELLAPFACSANVGVSVYWQCISGSCMRLQMLEEQAASGNAEALDDFLLKYAGSSSHPGHGRSEDHIPAQYGEQEHMIAPAERSITSSSRWMNAF